MLHYSVVLGGSVNIHYRDAHGDLVNKGNIKWFHEGLTEMHAQQIVTEHSFHSPSTYSYGYETELCFLLQNIVGKGVLKNAYLSGNFTLVKQILDKKLGANSFDYLIGKARGIEAVDWLTKKMKAAGMNPDLLINRWKFTRGTEHKERSVENNEKKDLSSIPPNNDLLNPK